MSEFRRSGGFGGGDRNRGNGGGGFRKSFGGPRSGGFGGGRSGGFRSDNRGGPREMFDATCASCNQPCKIPFKPNGSKPVYCNNCFGSKGDSNNFSRKESFGSSDAKPQMSEGKMNDLKMQVDAINAKLDKIIEMLRKDKSPVVSPEVEAVETVKETPVKKVKKVVKKKVVV